MVGDDAAMAVKPLVMVLHRKFLAADESKRLARLFSAYECDSEVTRDFDQTLRSRQHTGVLRRVIGALNICVKACY